ncbi:hypothetical protein [Streptomyces luteireticuli]|uniref:Uncharacterized protein n=1 Tax=Streptomyces luteireticuli TaxID=173858 RepID=A0ABN0YYZ9_9ACTN
MPAVRLPRRAVLPHGAVQANVVKQGGEVVLIDGTLILTQRHTGKADRRNCSSNIAATICASLL